MNAHQPPPAPKTQPPVILNVVLLLAAALAWIWTITGAGMGMSAVTMTEMAGTDVTTMSMVSPSWTLSYVVLVFSMWWVMMIAMMLPSAARPINAFFRTQHFSTERQIAGWRTFLFTAGYLVVWAVFSLVATVVQWQMQVSNLISPMLTLSNPTVIGLLLLAAGIWQLTPVRSRCLMQCRGAIRFDHPSAFLSGIRFGSACMACCWALMGLLFVGGVMNLYWIIGLTILVLLERLLGSSAITVAMGIGLIAWSAVLLLGPSQISEFEY